MLIAYLLFIESWYLPARDVLLWKSEYFSSIRGCYGVRMYFLTMETVWLQGPLLLLSLTLLKSMLLSSIYSRRFLHSLSSRNSKLSMNPTLIVNSTIYLSNNKIPSQEFWQEKRTKEI